MAYFISSTTARPLCLTLTTLVALIGGVGGAAAASLTVQSVIMTGLANPRGLAVGPDGAVYVAEAGSGGDIPIPAGDSGAAGFGQTAGISRYAAGVQERVVSGLPSLAGPGGSEATGVQDIAFGADGTLHAILGFGADPALRAGLPGNGGLLGQLVSVSGGSVTPVADVAAFEASANPDGGGVNSNPFSLVGLPGGGFAVSDAGGNDVLSVGAGGAIDVLGILPPAANPLPFGPPAYDPVPTGIALGANGEVFVAQLTGFPFPVGEAKVFRILDDLLSVYAGGLTNLIDVAVGEDGSVYALELDSDSLLGPLTTGALYSVGPSGTKDLLLGGLERPTGLAAGPNGRLYVSVNGLSATGGQVIELAPIPLSGSAGFLIASVVVMGGFRQRQRP